jgi:hypothetical protein
MIIHVLDVALGADFPIHCNSTRYIGLCEAIYKGTDTKYSDKSFLIKLT